MKKIFILIPILALLVSGCSLKQKTVIDGSASKDLVFPAIEQESDIKPLSQDLKESDNEIMEDDIGGKIASVYSDFYDLVEVNCDKVECLHVDEDSGYPQGVANVRGYYSPIERFTSEGDETCDGFTITSGSQELIDAMIHLIDKGDAFYSKNIYNQPIVSLGLQIISQSDKKEILDSATDRQIELMILSSSASRVSGAICAPDVIVLKKK